MHVHAGGRLTPAALRLGCPVTRPRAEGAGMVVAAPSRRALERRRAMHDKPGQHLWVFLAAWVTVDPERAVLPGASITLDGETLVMINGPGCFKCEGTYSRALARRPCPGEQQ